MSRRPWEWVEYFVCPDCVQLIKHGWGGVKVSDSAYPHFCADGYSFCSGDNMRTLNKMEESIFRLGGEAAVEALIRSDSYDLVRAAYNLGGKYAALEVMEDKDVV